MLAAAEGDDRIGRGILEALSAACSSRFVSAHPPLRPSRQSSSRGTPGAMPRTTGYAHANPTTDSQLPEPLPATHWDRSAPVPQMQLRHDDAHRRPSHCQARRNLEHFMSSAPILPVFDRQSAINTSLSASVCLSLGPCSSTSHFQPSTPDHFNSRRRKIPASFVSISSAIDEPS